MRFEVNGRPYFLNYLEDEGRWTLFRPGPHGFEQIAVEEDTAQPLFGRVIIPIEAEGTWIN
jgi:hypothetical protein